jgi:hypothetical protein
MQAVVGRGLTAQASDMQQEDLSLLADIFQVSIDRIGNFTWVSSIVPVWIGARGIGGYYEPTTSAGRPVVIWVDEFGTIIKTD